MAKAKQASAIADFPVCNSINRDNRVGCHFDESDAIFAQTNPVGSA
jgi:hypothetical protein